MLGGFWEGFAAFGLLVLFLHGVLPAGVFFGPVLQLPLGLPVACLLGGVEPYSFVCVVNLVFFCLFLATALGPCFPLVSCCGTLVSCLDRCLIKFFGL